MTSEHASSLAPSVQLLAEALQRLSRDGIITVNTSLAAAADALDCELSAVDPYSYRNDQAAALLALRIAGWPPATAVSHHDRLSFAHAAWDIQHLLATDDAPHVADLLRHSDFTNEASSPDSLDAMLGIASRAITEYRRLISTSRSPNERCT